MHGDMLLKHAAVEYQDSRGLSEHLRVKTTHFFQFAQTVPVWQVACLVTPVELRSGVRTSTHGALEAELRLGVRTSSLKSGP